MKTNSEMKAKVLALNARSGSVMKIKDVFFLMILYFSCDSESERVTKVKDGSQEYSVTADERQTCRQGQSQILLFTTLHLP